jgi:hypothetical protein
MAAGGPQIVEFGGPSGAPRRAAILPAAVALAVGLALGFLLGQRNPPGTPSARPSATPVQVNPLVGSGRTCAVTLPGPGGNDDLQLGSEVRNRSEQAVTIEAPGVNLPLAGLPIVGRPALAACGELPGSPDPVLPPGAATWVSVRVHVPGGACPAAQPVLFTVDYAVDGRHDRAEVGGFNDLGGVPYPSCT